MPDQGFFKAIHNETYRASSKVDKNGSLAPAKVGLNLAHKQARLLQGKTYASWTTFRDSALGLRVRGGGGTKSRKHGPLD